MTLTTNTAKPRPADLADPVAVARDLARTWQDGLIERDRAGGSATTEREGHCAPAAYCRWQFRNGSGDGVLTGPPSSR